MKNKYSIKVDNEKMAKALGKDLPISMKLSTQICKVIRNKELQKAKKILQEVIDMKKAIPMKKYNRGLAHRKEIGPGRYPVNAAKNILQILEQVESNAQFKGLDTGSLIINHITVNKAATPWHYGRKRRRKMKRAHIEVVVMEKEKEVKEEKSKEKKTENKEKGDKK